MDACLILTSAVVSNLIFIIYLSKFIFYEPNIHLVGVYIAIYFIHVTDFTLELRLGAALVLYCTCLSTGVHFNVWFIEKERCDVCIKGRCLDQ